MRHNLFEAQLASDTQVGGPPKLTFELANADSLALGDRAANRFQGLPADRCSRSSSICAPERPRPTPSVVFRGLMNPPELITETTFRLSAMNRISMQRTVVPERARGADVSVAFSGNRGAAAGGGGWRCAQGKYSPFYRCGYSPDQANGAGNLNGGAPFTSCSYTPFRLRTAGNVHHRYERPADRPVWRHRISCRRRSSCAARAEELAAFRRSEQHRGLQRFCSAGLWHAVDDARTWCSPEMTAI